MNKKAELEWERTWKNIVTNKDGTINIEQLKLELSDFSDMIERMTKLTSYVTGGMLSNPTYNIDALIPFINKSRKEELIQDREDDIEDGICRFCNQEI